MKLKKTLSAVTATALSLTMAFAFTACGDKDKEPVITDIALSETSLDIDTGDSKTLRVTATYDDESTKTLSASNVEWSSASDAIATVTYGSVVGVAKGETTITAKVGEITKSCTVTVHSLTISLDQTTLTVDKEQNAEGVQLTATVERDGVAVENPEIEWTSSDEAKVTVNNGLVKAWGEGEATVTAKLSNGQSATCAVTATWNKPVGYKPMEFAEQNKLHPGAWGYWYAKELSWNAGLATINPEGTYTSEFNENDSNLKAGYEYIGMGSATFEYEIVQYLEPHGYQIFFRSSDNFTDDEGVQGKLKFNHDYAVSLKVMSNVAGTIHVNPYDDIRKQGEGKGNEEETVEQYNAYLVAQEAAGKIKLAKNGTEYVTNENGVYVTDHDFVLEANKETEINVIFRHDDCGYIYASGVYDNMGTALHIQLADLGFDKENGVTRGRTVFSVYDVQFKDLGTATNPVDCEPSKHEGYVAPPPEGTEGETYEAVYTANNTDGDGLTTESTWAVWYPTDWGWNCGAPVDMEVTLDPDAKSCTLAFNPNGNENDWGVQLRYIPADVEVGQTFKVKLTINTDVAYSITLNGQKYDLEVGNNNIEYYWTKGGDKEGAWMLNGLINKAEHDGNITLKISNLTWTEFILAEAE